MKALRRLSKGLSISLNACVELDIQLVVVESHISSKGNHIIADYWK